MPPRSKLAAREIAALVKWVQDGAIDPRHGGPARLGGVTLEDAKKWWAFQPVKRPPVPRNDATHPVDAFIEAKRRQRRLTSSLAADRRTLLRRATYDLTGLPPTPEEIAAFVADRSPDAFARVVDRLLASPAYGERWGRHWLDLVRYADTAGENSDHPLPHGWRYRNWVIAAFNRDRPYDEFLREQLAGDLLAEKGPPDRYASRIIATGFLALARRFDHDSDRSMHLTHEDGIDTLGKALLGLTLGCARCHDHKYDAVTSRDYYALYGILDSSKFAFPGCEAKQQPRDLVPLLPKAEWDRIVKPHQQRLAKLDAEIQTARQEQARRSSTLKATSTRSRQVLMTGEIADGSEQSFEKRADPIAVEAGNLLLLSVSPLKNHGADSTFVQWQITEMGGKERRWDATAELVDDLLAGNPHADRHGNRQTWWFLDARDGLVPLPESLRDFSGKAGLNVWRNGDTPSVFVNASKAPIRVWTKLPPQSLFVHPSQAGAVAVGWLSPISGKVRISGRIKDAHPGGPDGVGWKIERLGADLRGNLVAVAAGAQRLRALQRRRAELIATAPRQEVAFAVVEGTPHDARMHLRGDPEKLGPVVPRRWLEVLGGQAVTTKTQSGRLELAHWIASKDNPLTARVLINRIWLHHFGKGLVKTPNDFGTRGQAPTHPELLDWLAAEFVESGWSIKAMHRTLMLSATYRQSSSAQEEAIASDPGNDWYWRFDRRRLSAEEVRDSLLAASGQLDRRPGEAHPFPPEPTWNYTQHVPFSTFFESDRRSVYLIGIRNRRHPFLGLFDGADPNATTPQRQTTTVPTQALYFMNDSFFHAQAAKVASRVLSRPEVGRLDELFCLALQRTPTAKDRELSGAFLARYRDSLPEKPAADRPRLAREALARILLASNEFQFVE
jgi:hypothetical protein